MNAFAKAIVVIAGLAFIAAGLELHWPNGWLIFAAFIAGGACT